MWTTVSPCRPPAGFVDAHAVVLVDAAARAVQGALSVVAQVQFESKSRKRFSVFYFQEINSGRFLLEIHRVNLHRPTSPLPIPKFIGRRDRDGRSTLLKRAACQYPPGRACMDVARQVIGCLVTQGAGVQNACQ